MSAKHKHQQIKTKTTENGM